MLELREEGCADTKKMVALAVDVWEEHGRALAGEAEIKREIDRCWKNTWRG